MSATSTSSHFGHLVNVSNSNPRTIHSSEGEQIRDAFTNQGFEDAAVHYWGVKSLLDTQATEPAKIQAKSATDQDRQGHHVLPYFCHHPPKLQPDYVLNERAGLESEAGCQKKWNIKCSSVCWKWFFDEVKKQPDMGEHSPEWRQLVQYAAEYVFAGLFVELAKKGLPPKFFVGDFKEPGESKSEFPEEGRGLGLESHSGSPKPNWMAIKAHMEGLVEELAKGFVEALQVEAERKKTRQFSHWNSLIAALLATIAMALLTATLGHAASMVALITAFHGAPLLCFATFLFVGLSAELFDYFVLSTEFKPNNGNMPNVVALFRHAFLCGAIFTLTAIALLAMNSVTPGISLLVAMLPFTAGLLASGGPILLAAFAFLSGAMVIGVGYFFAMGWKWCRGEREVPETIKEPERVCGLSDLSPSASFVNLHTSMGRKIAGRMPALTLEPLSGVISPFAQL